MRLITKVLPDNHNIFHFGDKHGGSVLSWDGGFLKMIDMMHSKYEGCSNNYGIEGGDDIEAIMVDDKRFSPDRLTEDLPLAQIKSAIKIRQPIKKKLLVKLMGNHERKLWRFGDITQKICDELEVDYGTYSAKITIKDKNDNLMYKIFETHGSRSITSTADDPKRRRSNMELILKRQLKEKAGDCAVMIKHHAHKLLVSKPESELYLVDNGKEIVAGYTGLRQTDPYIDQNERWYGCAGSFLRLYGDGISGYAEIGEYDPVTLGFLVLIVRDRKIVELKPIYL
jgi:hypothetical protein